MIKYKKSLHLTCVWSEQHKINIWKRLHQGTEQLFKSVRFPIHFWHNTVWKQSAQDDATIQMSGDDLDLPEELAKMVEEDEEEEEINDSFLGKLQNMDVDFDAIKAKAQNTMSEVKQTAEEKCVTM